MYFAERQKGETALSQFFVCNRFMVKNLLGHKIRSERMRRFSLMHKLLPFYKPLEIERSAQAITAAGWRGSTRIRTPSRGR
jgi:hypothetical protein